MELTLKRFTAANDDGVPGVLMHGANIVCFTLEEDWKDNQKSVSCIPEGTYTCKKHRRPSGVLTYQVMDVPNRTFILIHPGNTEEDVEGCILVGKEFGKKTVTDEESGIVRPKLAVLRSKEAFNEFMNLTNNRESFTLIIKWC